MMPRVKKACHSREQVHKKGQCRHPECKTKQSTKLTKGQLKGKSGELGLELSARSRLIRRTAAQSIWSLQQVPVGPANPIAVLGVMSERGTC